MELDLGVIPVVRKKYPHMGFQDRAVWTGVLERWPGRIDRVWYDVKVGTPSDMGSDCSPADLRLGEGMGCKRIDVVCRIGGRMYVVEVKPYGNHAALGQVLLYEDLFRARYPRYANVGMVIACASLDQDMANVCARYHVGRWEVSGVVEDVGALPGVGG